MSENHNEEIANRIRRAFCCGLARAKACNRHNVPVPPSGYTEKQREAFNRGVVQYSCENVYALNESDNLPVSDGT